MKTKKNIYKLSSLILLLSLCHPVKAQMNMTGTQHPAAPRQIFLLMMDTMMVKMDHSPSAAAPEMDFIYQMIPHHEGAIAMAGYEIRHGGNPEMIRLAKSILAEQRSEIEQMRLWMKLPATTLSNPSAYHREMENTMKTMMETMPATAELNNTDKAFAEVMIPHHQAAVDMTRVLIKYAKQPILTAYGKQLISDEQVEIEQMKTFLNQ